MLLILELNKKVMMLIKLKNQLEVFLLLLVIVKEESQDNKQ